MADKRRYIWELRKKPSLRAKYTLARNLISEYKDLHPTSLFKQNFVHFPLRPALGLIHRLSPNFNFRAYIYLASHDPRPASLPPIIEPAIFKARTFIRLACLIFDSSQLVESRATTRPISKSSFSRLVDIIIIRPICYYLHYRCCSL